MEKKSKFKKGMRVFAKIKGFPYWPAIVEKIDFSSKMPKYDVIFFGDNEIGLSIKESDICLFSENKSRLHQLNKKNKKFSTAMKEAELSLDKSSVLKTRMVLSQSNTSTRGVNISHPTETPQAMSSPILSSVTQNLNSTLNSSVHISEKENMSEQLLESRWVTDDVIQIYFDLLNDKITKDDIYFVNPSIVQAVKCLEDFDRTLGPLKLNEKSIVFIPVSDSPPVFRRWNEFGSTGTHWSLLLFDKVNNSFYYFDSMASANYEHARAISRNFKSILDITNEPSFIKVKTPQQENTVDCGIYTLLVADAITLKLVEDSNFNLTPELLGDILPSVTESDVLIKRAILALLIHKNRYINMNKDVLRSMMFNQCWQNECTTLQMKNSILQCQKQEVEEQIQKLLDLNTLEKQSLTKASTTVNSVKKPFFNTVLHTKGTQSNGWSLVPKHKGSKPQQLLSRQQNISTRNRFNLLSKTILVGNGKNAHMQCNSSQLSHRKFLKHKKAGYNLNVTKYTGKNIKLSLYSDSQGREVSHIINSASNNLIKSEGYVMANAPLSHVTSVANKMSSGEVIVIIGGTNDSLNDDFSYVYRSWENGVASLSADKPVIVTTIPERFDCSNKNNPIHAKVKEVNNYIRELALRLSNVYLVDLSELKRFHYTSQGLHLNKRGKTKLVFLIFSVLNGVFTQDQSISRIQTCQKTKVNNSKKLETCLNSQSLDSFPPLVTNGFKRMSNFNQHENQSNNMVRKMGVTTFQTAATAEGVNHITTIDESTEERSTISPSMTVGALRREESLKASSQCVSSDDSMVNSVSVSACSSSPVAGHTLNTQHITTYTRHIPLHTTHNIVNVPSHDKNVNTLSIVNLNNEGSLDVNVNNDSLSLSHGALKNCI